VISGQTNVSKFREIFDALTSCDKPNQTSHGYRVVYQIDVKILDTEREAERRRCQYQHEKTEFKYQHHPFRAQHVQTMSFGTVWKQHRAKCRARKQYAEKLPNTFKGRFDNTGFRIIAGRNILAKYTRDNALIPTFAEDDITIRRGPKQINYDTNSYLFQSY
jgi:hypothetical protein